MIDPSSGRHGRFDVAIVGERIARIAANLPAHRARTTVDASAYYVTPGLIDLHAYVNAQAVFRQGDPRTGWRNVNPDHNTLRHGVTTVVDAGSTGWKNFESFKQLVIDRSQVRVLAFLNIVGSGMLEGEAAADPSDLEVEKAVDTARKHPETIVGIRSPHLQGAGPDAVERSIRAAASMGGVALVEYLEKEGLDYRQLVLERLRAGDLITHTFGAHHARARFERQSDQHADRGAEARGSFRSRTRHPGLLRSATPSPPRGRDFFPTSSRRPWTRPASCCLVPT